MKHAERIQDYLEHILEAMDRCAGYLEPIHGLEAFQKNRQVQDAVVRNIEIIGEAASKISGTAPDFVKRHSDIPWQQMRAMRNLVIHEYFFVDLQIVWNTVKQDFPTLKQKIQALLAS